MDKSQGFYDKIVGKQYGKLMVNEIKRTSVNGYSIAVCDCSCGNVVNVELSKLLLGIVKSCGCARKRKDDEDSELYSETICWKCVRSGNTCPWMNNFTPVKGWVAERFDYSIYRPYDNKNIVDSYIVKECPLFLKRKKKK